MKKILGIGNALVDFIVKVNNEGIFDDFGLKKGGMTMVDEQTKRTIHSTLSSFERTITSGGSAANTIHGLAHLGMKTGFIGKISHDAMGLFFEEDLLDNGVTPHLVYSSSDTGIATTILTPDAERTFATYLGAAAELLTSDIDESILDEYDMIHIEGYLIHNHEFYRAICELAKKHGLQISMDMASFNLMEAHRDFMLDILKNYVDIVFGNEQEVRSLMGMEETAALDLLSQSCPVAVIKLGPKGSIVSVYGEKATISPAPGNCFDTNGLGDIYASGFLYGLLNGYSPKRAGDLASFLAARLGETLGAKLSIEQWNNIKEEINKI
ncbi:MAG: adenosine kinase [Bacteroidales bacterium]|nr:adenosine kinase [Bacteroidales bacterium]